MQLVRADHTDRRGDGDVLEVAVAGQVGRYCDAPDVEAVARELIAEIPEHRHLATARIRYLFRAGTWASRGRLVLGRAAVLSERDQLLSGGYEAVVIVNRLAWQALSQEARRALVDHELSHLARDDEGDLTLAGHDVEEFAAVIRRHGLWTEELRLIGRVVQERLPLEVAGE